MNATVSALVRRLDSSALADANVIPWSCPVPSFGDLSRSEVATLGLNPSNREFVDNSGQELDGPSRRFHTLRSFGLEKWSEAEEEHFELITDSCRRYFVNNPYDTWFKRLDNLLFGTGKSYYSSLFPACHLDLIPYATSCKWTFLTGSQRNALLNEAGSTLASLLKESPVRILILNGKSVVDHFQETTGSELRQKAMKEWTLPRRSAVGVKGIAYHGSFRKLSGIDLGRELVVLGYNHNLQSSFGVTNQVTRAIREWISRTLKGGAS